jgi:hypothetical protein
VSFHSLLFAGVYCWNPELAREAVRNNEVFEEEEKVVWQGV